MARLRRWPVVAAVLAVLLSLPAALNSIPVSNSTIPATTLLAKIRNSGSLGYSGYAEATGGLALPVTSRFGSLADLFGGHSQLRVWWRGAKDSRVDQVDVAGETDVHTDDSGTWSWNYEENSATRIDSSINPLVRLPSAADLLPASLGRRLLSEAADGEVSRLDTVRIAGRTAAGLRLRPSDVATTIDHVDIWADTITGIPLRVEVYGANDANPAMATEFLDFNATMPAAATTRFLLPSGAELNIEQQQNLSGALGRFFGDVPVPKTLAGIALNGQLPSFGGVGVYGHGVTEFVAVPMTGRTANSLRRELLSAPGIADGPDGQSVVVGPLSLLLTSTLTPGGLYWLLTGTVTRATLTAAAAELARFGGG
ncbi:MAG TPA: hypothetical protein VGH11_17150 [Jatrophihabitans sp.]|jgi:hypothetical protein